jgi:hypothetical protein
MCHWSWRITQVRSRKALANLGHKAHRPEIDRGTELVVYAEPGLGLFHGMEAAHVFFVLPDHLVHASGAEDCCVGGGKCSPCIMGEGIGTSSQVGSHFEVDFRLMHISKVNQFGVVGVESGIVAKLLQVGLYVLQGNLLLELYFYQLEILVDREANEH